jgi:hypothetical protein
VIEEEPTLFSDRHVSTITSAGAMVEVRPVTIKAPALLSGSPANPGTTAQLEGPAAPAVQALTLVPPPGHSIMESRI